MVLILKKRIATLDAFNCLTSMSSQKKQNKSEIVDINEVTKNADSFILADIFAIFLSIIFTIAILFIYLLFYFFCISL